MPYSILNFYVNQPTINNESIKKKPFGNSKMFRFLIQHNQTAKCTELRRETCYYQSVIHVCNLITTNSHKFEDF